MQNLIWHAKVKGSRILRSVGCGLALGLFAAIVASSAASDATPAVPPASRPAASAAQPAVAPASSVVPDAALAVVSEVRIVQARASTPNIAVYLNIRAENGAAVTNVRVEQLQADVGPYPTSAKSLKPFPGSGEGIAYIFLVDVSKSLKPNQFDQIRNALAQWVEKMADKDRAAVVSFGASVKTVQDFTADKTLLKTKINGLVASDVQTRLNEGLIRALDLGRRDDVDLPRRRVIVTLTDGIADTAGGSTREDTMARIKEEPVPIYAIGFAAASVSAAERDKGFKALGAFAHASGGSFIAAGTSSFSKIYAELHDRIHEAYLLLLECPTCPSDGRAYPLRIKLQAGNRVLTATSEVRLSPPEVLPVTAPGLPSKKSIAIPLWVWFAGSGFLIASLFFWVARRKKAKLKYQQADQAQSDAVPGVPPVDVSNDSVAISMSPSRPGIPLRLTAVSGSHHGREWLTEVGVETIIGRSAQCDVVIDDDSEVSSRNSALSSEGGLLFVEDLGSKNGTSINGSPITGRRRVGDGDLILVGRTELRLTFVKT